MKSIVFLSILLTLFALLFPIFLYGGSGGAGEGQTAPSPALSPSASPGETPVVESAADQETMVRLLQEGEVQTLPLSDYLVSVLAAEMPASFAPEALKAQAVAARTYTLYKRAVNPSANHPEADVCGDSSCCKAYITDGELRERWGEDYADNLAKIQTAVQETDGEYLLYEGQPALAVFHSSSPGKTEDCANVWGTGLPYLISVDSPETGEDVPNYTYTVTVSASDFRATIQETYPDAVFPENIKEWIGEIVRTESGRIQTASVAGVDIPGAALRNLFDLRSTYIDIVIGEDAVTFNTTGYGHGVGMSQYGANTMAEQGESYQEILAHYYPGTQLSHVASWPEA